MADLVYILSPSYSGSTLLTFLLGAHPGVATIGELKGQALGDIDKYACSCEAKIKECSFWREVSRKTAAMGMAFVPGDFGTHFCHPTRGRLDRVLRARVRGGAFESARNVALAVMPGAGKHIRHIMRRNRILIEAIREAQGGEVFLDGSKDPIRLKYMMDAGLWRIKVLYMRRDGRGTSRSYMRHYDRSMEWAATEWRDTHLECDRLTAGLTSENRMTVYYEDLCLTPDETLASIFRFLGLDPSDARRDFRSVEHHIIGNTMRLTGTSEIRHDEKWKTALTDEDLAVFERIGGALNRSQGYQGDRSSSAACRAGAVSE